MPTRRVRVSASRAGKQDRTVVVLTVSVDNSDTGGDDSDHAAATATTAAADETEFALLLKQLTQKLRLASNSKSKSKSVRAFVASDAREVCVSNYRQLFVDGVKLVLTKGEAYTITAAAPPAGGGVAAAAAAAAAAGDSDQGPDVSMGDRNNVHNTDNVPSYGESVGDGADTVRIAVIARHADVEDDAVSQLRRTATTLPRMRVGVGMPDLHPGNQFPIGTAFASEGVFYPALIGGDIGCGISLIQTRRLASSCDKSARRVKSWANKLRGLDCAYRPDAAAVADAAADAEELAVYNYGDSDNDVDDDEEENDADGDDGDNVGDDGDDMADDSNTAVHRWTVRDWLTRPLTWGRNFQVTPPSKPAVAADVDVTTDGHHVWRDMGGFVVDAVPHVSMSLSTNTVAANNGGPEVVRDSCASDKNDDGDDSDVDDNGDDGDVDDEDAERRSRVSLAEYDRALGTIGGGNHFAELQRVEEVVDEDEFARLRLSRKHLYLLVHSGSRGLGKAVLDAHQSGQARRVRRQQQRRQQAQQKDQQQHQHSSSQLVDADAALDVIQHGGLCNDTTRPDTDSNRYLAIHHTACHWAKRNRALIAFRFLNALGLLSPADAADMLGIDTAVGTDDGGGGGGGDDASEDRVKVVLDVWHNFLTEKVFSSSTTSSSSTLWLHRKGAAPSDVGPVVIPGSRGAMSYLVVPAAAATDDDGVDAELQRQRQQQWAAAYSLAHGAGRKWARKHARAKGQHTYDDKKSKKSSSSTRSADALRTTALDSHVICEDIDLLYEEVPDAYKDVGAVVRDLVELGGVRVVAVLRPVITYKCRANEQQRSGGGGSGGGGSRRKGGHRG